MQKTHNKEFEQIKLKTSQKKERGYSACVTIGLYVAHAHLVVGRVNKRIFCDCIRDGSAQWRLTSLELQTVPRALENNTHLELVIVKEQAHVPGVVHVQTDLRRTAEKWKLRDEKLEERALLLTTGSLYCYTILLDKQKRFYVIDSHGEFATITRCSTVDVLLYYLKTELKVDHCMEFDISWLEKKSSLSLSYVKTERIKNVTSEQ